MNPFDDHSRRLKKLTVSLSALESLIQGKGSVSVTGLPADLRIVSSAPSNHLDGVFEAVCWSESFPPLFRGSYVPELVYGWHDTSE